MDDLDKYIEEREKEEPGFRKRLYDALKQSGPRTKRYPHAEVNYPYQPKGFPKGFKK